MHTINPLRLLGCLVLSTHVHIHTCDARCYESVTLEDSVLLGCQNVLCWDVIAAVFEEVDLTSVRLTCLSWRDLLVALST